MFTCVVYDFKRSEFVSYFSVDFINLSIAKRSLEMFITHYFGIGGLAFEIMIVAYNTHHHSLCYWG